MRWIAAVLVCSTLACVSRSSDEPRNAHQLLQESLQARYAAAPAVRDLGAAVADSMKVVTESSRAVPGLVYHWGTYSPPNTADAGVWGVAAELNGKARILQAPADWAALVSLGSWLPGNESQVVEACAEVVRTVGPRRENYPRPVLFRDSSSLANVLTDELPLLPESRPSIWSRAEKPRGERQDGGWTSLLWAVEMGQTTKYRCEFDKSGAKLDVRLTSVDSIPKVGLMTGPPTSE